MPHPLANLDGLVRLSNTEGVDIRRPLLRVLTDLYVQERSHTREEEQQYVELTLRLLPCVDAATRAAVARKLAAYPQTPVAIIEALSRDDAEIVALFAGAAAHPAERGPASPRESEKPMPTCDEDTAAPAVQAPIATDGIGEVFLASGAAERVAFLENMERATADVPTPTVNMLVRPGASQRLEQAAMRRDADEFARELRLSLGITSATAQRIAEDDSGEALIVAIRALGMQEDALVRTLLFLNPAIGQSIERVFSLVPLYNRLTMAMIEPVVASWREEAAAQPTGRFQPLHAADEHSSLSSARENARTPRDGTIDHGIRRGVGTERRQRGQGTA